MCASSATVAFFAMIWRSWGGEKTTRIFAAALSGAFLRVELRGLMASSDGATRVLYTDCDVIFLGEAVPQLEANPCEYFAVAPEGQQTGVMLMNTERLRESLSEFREYIRQNLASSSVNRGTKQPSAGSIEIVMGRSGTG